jgi:hypothetical protein
MRLADPHPAPAPVVDATTGEPRTRPRRSRETVLFRGALAVIAAHVLDDNYLQPQPGTSPGDHVVSGLVPLTLLGLAAWSYPLLRGGPRGQGPRGRRGSPAPGARSLSESMVTSAAITI